MFYLYNRTTSPSDYDSEILGTKVQNALKNSPLIAHVGDYTVLAVAKLEV